jgi:hypothetical protein
MSKPVVRHREIVRSGREPPVISQFVFADLAIGCAYTLLTIAAVERPNDTLGSLMRQWIEFNAGAVQAILFFLPEPQSTTSFGLADRIASYRHALVACTLFMVTSVLASRRHWPQWANQFVIRLRATGMPTDRVPDAALLGYRTMIIGIVAVMFLLLFAEPRGDGAMGFLYGNSGSFFRAPALTAIAGAFACHAAALRSCLPIDLEDF